MNQQMSVGAERDASSDGRARPQPLSMPATDRSRPAPVLALDPGGTYLRTAAVEAGGTFRARRLAPTQQPLDLPAAERGLQGYPWGPVVVAVVASADPFGPERIMAGGGIALARGQGSLVPAGEGVAAHPRWVQAARVRSVSAALGEDVSIVRALPLVAYGV